MVTIHLSEQRCVACEGGVPPLSREQVRALLPQVPGWEVSPDHTLLSHDYECRDFAEALAFLEQVGALAEAEGHHPDLHLTAYRYLRIELFTHAIGGLSQNDFILAAKINQLRSW